MCYEGANAGANAGAKEEMRYVNARGVIIGISFALALMATAQTFSQQGAIVTGPSVDQVRIETLEKLPSQVMDHEKRLIHLEDAVANINETGEETKWWLRGIGAALVLAIAERVLRTAGVLSRTDGEGPVG